MRSSRRILSAAVLVALLGPGVADGATPQPGAPAIDQYIEQIPTPSGPQPTSVEERVQPLPAAAQRELEAEAGADAEVLTEIATSSRYGAPVEPKVVTPPEDRGETDTGEGASEGSERADEVMAIDAVPASTDEGGDTRLAILVAFMAGSLVAALVFRRASRR
jgi:hypothetical protein